MKKLDKLFEGSSKRIYSTDMDGLIVLEFKDEVAAFFGMKRGCVPGKGAMNNRMTNYLMRILEKNGIPTDYVDEISSTETLVRRAKVIPVQVVVRNVAAGSLCNRLGMPEGTPLKRTVLEYRLRSDELEDPMINESHIALMNLADANSVRQMADYALKINTILRSVAADAGILLVDIHLYFGLLPDGKLILCGEISPDSCRMWDARTHERLDKDCFRQGIGDPAAAYREVYNRILGDEA